MSDFNKTYENVIVTYEGGYRPAPMETYRGIDRTQDPGVYWDGWRIIDAYKKKGPIKRYTVIKDAKLEDSVKQFYLTKYLPSMIKPTPEAIQNQTLADIVTDFIVHKPYDAIRIINNLVRKYRPQTIINPTRLTPDVVAVLNSNPKQFYSLVRQSRIGYYKNPGAFGSIVFKNGFTKSNRDEFLKRANNFPETA